MHIEKSMKSKSFLFLLDRIGHKNKNRPLRMRQGKDKDNFANVQLLTTNRPKGLLSIILRDTSGSAKATRIKAYKSMKQI
jgi:hypothetical protein